MVILGINAPSHEDEVVIAAQIKKRFPNSELIVLDDRVSPVLTLTYMRDGAKGYISKNSDLKDLDFIDLVLSGKMYINPEHFEVLLDQNTKDYKASKRKKSLTSG